MARKRTTIDSLTKLFDNSSRPIYAIDAQSQIVYSNRALTAWLEMEPKRIIGRTVEFHSEPAKDDEEGLDPAPLTELCPPPRAFAGEPCTGTLSCMARDGRLVHRHAEFVPLGIAGTAKANRKKEPLVAQRFAVLVLLAAANMSAEEVSTELSAEPKSDDLHRTIRRFRRAQAGRYSIESLLGSSPPMQKVRAQMAAAVASKANTLIYGPRGSGRGHIARAIHYCAASSADTKLVPVDCELLSDDIFRRVMDALRSAKSGNEESTTLLLENIDRMSASHQSLLAQTIHEKSLAARIIATCSRQTPCAMAETETANTIDSADAEPHADFIQSMPVNIGPALLNAISTITIHLPHLANRADDLPVLAQYFLEACNQGSGKQVGSIRSDTLDLLALYSWPGELDQLRATVKAAHRKCTTHEISPTDVPPTIQHAAQAASRARRGPERIILDDLLALIEKEAIVRALTQSDGNKSEAASLLGMTRPRLYRRLVQLGLASEGEEPRREQPKFIERDPTE